LVLGHIVVSFLADRKAKEPLTPPALPAAAAAGGGSAAELSALGSASQVGAAPAIRQEEAVELLKSLASRAPLLVGGLILIGLAALTSGGLVFEATTTVGS
jgi:hypothetical protein